MTKRYFKFDEAGDQFVARILSGVSLESVEFGSLLPRFAEEVDHDVLERTLVQLFGDIPKEFFNEKTYSALVG